MKDHQLLDAVGGIDAGYVYSADRPAARKRHTARWIAAAACLCVVAAGGFAAADIFPLVTVDLALAVGDLQFHEALLEVHFERYQRSALATEPLAELEDLLLV